MARTIIACIGALALAGCATTPIPQPQPDIVVYTGLPNDPRYQVPPEYRDPARIGERAERARFQQEAQAVHERVMRDPAFGGLVLRWEPQPYAVVMFTGDAETRLRRYTRDPRFRAKKVDISMAELERMKDGVSRQAIDPRIRCLSVDADEEHNTVTLSAPPHELEMVRAAIAEGRFKPPPKLRLEMGSCVELR